MNDLTHAENWVSQRLWWTVAVLVIVLTLSVQGLFFFLQYRDVQQQVVEYQKELYRHEFSDLRSHLQREFNLIKQSIQSNSFSEEQTLARLREQRFGLENRGYFFVLELNDIQGGANFAKHLLLPIDPLQEGVPMDSGELDTKGFAYREAYLEQLRQQSEAEVSYWYVKPDSHFEAQKTSYIYFIPELSWILGAGIYLDDFHSLVQKYNEKQRSDLINRGVWALAFSLLMIVIALSFIRRYQRRLMTRLRSLYQQIERYQKEIINYNQRLKEDVEKKAQELSDLYQLDSLTQVYNRSRLSQDLMFVDEDQLAIMVNIDGFKEINEIFGGDVGDVILKSMAYKLKNLDKTASVYRLNGDVFVVLFAKADIPALSDYILSVHYHLVHDRLAQFDDHDVEYNVTVVAAWAQQNLLSRLEMTMLHAKSKRLNTLCYRDEFDFGELYRANLNVTHKVREAIEQDRVFPVFQAIRDLKSNQVTHYECLIRIQQADGQMVPAEFLEVAQKSKLYPDLMQVMLRKSFAIFADSTLSFSLNLSYEDIISQDIRNTLAELLTDDNAHRVVFEILESEGIENYPEVSNFISLVKAKGAKIAIDDFGSGYSNFEHLLKLQVDYLKLDGTLIEALMESEQARYIVESIVYFAKKVGIAVVAEFVSQPELVAKVKELGIDYAQGYAIGHPSKALSQTDSYSALS